MTRSFREKKVLEKVSPKKKDEEDYTSSSTSKKSSNTTSYNTIFTNEKKPS